MKQLFTLLFALLFSLQLSAKEKEIESAIDHVTVFINGAQVHRTAELTLTKGVHQLTFSNLASSLDPSSVQVKGFGNFTILSVKHQFDFVDLEEEENALMEQEPQWQDSLNWYKSELKVYEEEESLLKTNKNLGSSQSGVDIVKLQQAADFYRSRLQAINQKKFALKRQIEAIKSKQEEIKKQLRDIWEKEKEEISEVIVTVSAEQWTKGNMQLTYYVPDAGWSPAYDVRVENTDKPVTLNYKAKVFQNTSEDWEDVKLSLSSGNPLLKADLPQLQSSYISFIRNISSQLQGRAAGVDIRNHRYNPTIRKVRGTVRSAEDGYGLPGVNVAFKGYKKGTLTDINGFYEIDVPNGARTMIFQFVGMKTVEIPVYSSVINLSMQNDVKQLSEVVVTGYAKSKKSNRASGSIEPDELEFMEEAATLDIQVEEQPTTTRFDIALPYSIPANGEEQTVEIKKLKLNTNYEYYASPELSPNAFLTAKVSGWEESHLMSGPTNLYLDGTFVGSSSLDFSAKSDTLTLSMGQDRNLSVSREKVKTERNTTYSSKKEKMHWKVTVRNHKGRTVQFKIQERIPVSNHKDIDVDFEKPENAKFNEDTGILTWILTMKPHETKEIAYEYEVSYPKDQNVYVQ